MTKIHFKMPYARPQAIIFNPIIFLDNYIFYVLLVFRVYNIDFVGGKGNLAQKLLSYIRVIRFAKHSHYKLRKFKDTI